MLDRHQIASASQTLHDHWRAGTKLDALDDWHAAAESRRGLCDPGRDRAIFDHASVRLEDRGHQRGRTEAHQCRRPDGRTHPRRDRDCRRRHGVDGRQRDARRRAGIRLPHARRFAGAIDALHRAAGARCRRHAASGDRDSGFALCRFRRRRRSAAHRRQCLRASVRARTGHDGGLARARSGRGTPRHHHARPAIHRPRQERARRSPPRADLACQRIAPARRRP